MQRIPFDMARTGVYAAGMAAKKTISEALREAMRRDGRSVTRIAADAGVAQAVLCRFYNGTRGLTLKVADRLAEELDLELRPRKTGR